MDELFEEVRRKVLGYNYLNLMEMITGNGLSVEDRFQVQTKQGNLLLEV